MISCILVTNSNETIWNFKGSCWPDLPFVQYVLKGIMQGILYNNLFLDSGWPSDARWATYKPNNTGHFESET